MNFEIGSAHRAIGSRSESGAHIVATPRLPLLKEIWATGLKINRRPIDNSDRFPVEPVSAF